MTRLESFDVFDTVLTRVVGAPVSVFILLAKMLRDRSIIAVEPQDFARMRVEAEAYARRKHPYGEVTLEMIYSELAAALALSGDGWRHAMRLECEIEEMLLRVVPSAADQVSHARRRNGKAIFVSDMYFPSELVIRWLEQHGLWHEGDRLYLSNEEHASKATGKLFRRVLQEESLTPTLLKHRGNDAHSDVASALRQGVKVHPFPEGNLLRYEKLMEGDAAATRGLSSLLAGASRLARLSVLGVDASRTALRDVSAGVIAPTLVAYVIWVLRRAQALSLRRLYFVSRDGQILLEIARRLAPKLGVKCELRYLYSSRQSWHFPAIMKLDETKLEWIFMKYDFLSIESLLFRVRIAPSEVADELSIAGFGPSQWNRELRVDEIERLRPLLLRGALHDLILSRASAKREMLIGYLRQEGLLGGEPWALVDIGWNGGPQGSLGEVLKSVNGPLPYGFYFGLASRPSGESAGTFDAYMFDEDNTKYRAALSKVHISTIMEIACSADHGSVDEFTQTGCSYEPMLRCERNQLAIDWGLPFMQQTICQFADYLVLDDSIVDTSADLRPTVVTLLNAFWEHPTRLEVVAWGCFDFESDQSGATNHHIAQPYTIDAIVRALLRRNIRPFTSFWVQGSILISPWPIRVALRLGLRLKRFLRKNTGIASRS